MWRSLGGLLHRPWQRLTRRRRTKPSSYTSSNRHARGTSYQAFLPHIFKSSCPGFIVPSLPPTHLHIGMPGVHCTKPSSHTTSYRHARGISYQVLPLTHLHNGMPGVYRTKPSSHTPANCHARDLLCQAFLPHIFKSSYPGFIVPSLPPTHFLNGMPGVYRVNLPPTHLQIVMSGIHRTKPSSHTTSNRHARGISYKAFLPHIFISSYPGFIVPSLPPTYLQIGMPRV